MGVWHTALCRQVRKEVASLVRVEPGGVAAGVELPSATPVRAEPVQGVVYASPVPGPGVAPLREV